MMGRTMTMLQIAEQQIDELREQFGCAQVGDIAAIERTLTNLMVHVSAIARGILDMDSHYVERSPILGHAPTEAEPPPPPGPTDRFGPMPRVVVIPTPRQAAFALAAITALADEPQLRKLAALGCIPILSPDELDDLVATLTDWSKQEDIPS